MLQIIAATVVLLALALVAGRILKVGCSVAAGLLYLLVLLLAAVILFSFLQEIGLFEVQRSQAP